MQSLYIISFIYKTKVCQEMIVLSRDLAISMNKSVVFLAYHVTQEGFPEVFI